MLLFKSISISRMHNVWKRLVICEETEVVVPSLGPCPSLCPSGFLPITQSLKRTGPQAHLDCILQEQGISLKVLVKEFDFTVNFGRQSKNCQACESPEGSVYNCSHAVLTRAPGPPTPSSICEKGQQVAGSVC